METKYTLSEVTKEEQALFMQELQELFDKHSVYFEPVPQFTRKSLQSPWEIVCQIFLQKKTPIAEAEKVDSVPSPFTDETPTA